MKHLSTIVIAAGALPCQVTDVARHDGESDSLFDRSFRQFVMARAARFVGRDEGLIQQEDFHRGGL